MPKGTPDKGYVMTPHRQRIMEILLASPVEDTDGRAVAKLMAKTGHKTTNALSGVLETMERQGLIRRQVAGRRTYRIEAASDALAPEDAVHVTTIERTSEGSLVVTPDAGDGIDYDLLAGVLLAKALKATQAQEDAAQARGAEERARKAEASAEIHRADAQAARAKVAELEAVVKTLEHNLKAVSAQLDKRATRQGTPVRDLLDKTTLKDLDQLMRSLPAAHRG